MTSHQAQNSPEYLGLLNQGIHEFNGGHSDASLQLFKHAAATAFGSTEPWFWIGRIYEEHGDRIRAAYCFYMACDVGSPYAPAKEALERLGYLSSKESRHEF